MLPIQLPWVSNVLRRLLDVRGAQLGLEERVLPVFDVATRFPDLAREQGIARFAARLPKAAVPARFNGYTIAKTVADPGLLVVVTNIQAPDGFGWVAGWNAVVGLNATAVAVQDLDQSSTLLPPAVISDVSAVAYDFAAALAANLFHSHIAGTVPWGQWPAVLLPNVLDTNGVGANVLQVSHTVANQNLEHIIEGYVVRSRS